MEETTFYSDRKYCPECDAYVPYLMSMEHSYCVCCGSRVRLFSKDDWVRFSEELKERRPKGGRPRKHRDKESA